MDHLDIARRFMTVEGLSGYESKVAYLLRDVLAPIADDVSIDRAGNVIARIEGTDASAPVVMITAHMDQLGFVVRKIEPSGLIQIERVGGIPEKVLPALKVSVGTLDNEYIPGVIGVKSHHVTPAEEKYKVDLVTSLLVDIGAPDGDAVKAAGVRVGCPIVYRPSFESLMDGKICGTAVDDRCGVAALVDVAERLRKDRPKSTTCLVGTVMEEFNIRGAVIAARRVKPDIVLCLDITMSGDTPDLSAKYELKLGGGPTVGLYNFHGRGTLNGHLAHAGLYRLARSCADKAGLNLQEFASVGLLTECAYLQLEREYVACLDLGFPARYVHSPVETCHLDDLKGLGRLVFDMVRSIDGGFKLGRY